MINNEEISEIFIEINSRDIIYLGQNIPNPFNEHTQIPFYLPTTVKVATIQFTDSKGSIIKSIEINDRGKGVIHIAAAELNSSVYNYTLIADGNVIDTKRMVKN